MKRFSNNRPNATHCHAHPRDEQASRTPDAIRVRHAIYQVHEDGTVDSVVPHDSINAAKRESRRLQRKFGDVVQVRTTHPTGD